MRSVYLVAAAAFCSILLGADDSSVIRSLYARSDAPLTPDPQSPFWKAAPAVTADRDGFGKITPHHRTEIRSRWTKDNLYIQFTCPYEQLYLKPNPLPAGKETNQLWDYDVAEAFIGWDAAHPHRYKEFEVSPRGEWVDLDIDRDHPLPEEGWKWNSGFEVKTRVDEKAKIWYGAMRIPFHSIDERQPKPGNTLRVNFYRMQGPPPNRRSIAWRPTHSETFHVPEAFGTMRLVQ